MKYIIISKEEAIEKGINLEDKEVIFDYISVETLEDDLRYIHGNRYELTEYTLSKAIDHVIYKMSSPYRTDLVIDSLIENGILK